jgi:hypothetical protein
MLRRKPQPSSSMSTSLQFSQWQAGLSCILTFSSESFIHSPHERRKAIILSMFPIEQGVLLALATLVYRLEQNACTSLLGCNFSGIFVP